MNHFKLLLMTLVVGISQLATASSLSLQLNGQEFSGQIINLQQMIYQYYPGYRIDPASLRSVTLIAKGWDGRTDAELRLDGRSMDRKRVEGFGRDFYNNDPRTYFSTTLMNFQNYPARMWEISFQGPVRILSLNIDLADYNQPHPPHQPPYQPRIEYYEIGNERVQKLIETESVFHPQHFDDLVDRVRIVGTVEKVRITSAVVVFNNGEMRQLPELQQTISSGQEIGAFLQDRPIQEIRIKAVSGNLSGSRGEYKISIGVLR